MNWRPSSTQFFFLMLLGGALFIFAVFIPLIQLGVLPK
jgi:hypothetical protein